MIDCTNTLSSFVFKGGSELGIVIPIKANCIDSTAEPEAVFARKVEIMQAEKMKPQEQVTLEPYVRDHTVVVGIYRAPPRRRSENLSSAFVLLFLLSYLIYFIKEVVPTKK